MIEMLIISDGSDVIGLHDTGMVKTTENIKNIPKKLLRNVF